MNLKKDEMIAFISKTISKSNSNKVGAIVKYF